MDMNNQIIPIATGVSQSETNKSWTWFLSKLKDCIREVPNLTIISDRHYAITHACKNMFPNYFHGYCCRHLMMNCNMQSDKLNGIYWKTFKAYTIAEFEKFISLICYVRPDSHRKLVEAGFSKWSRAMCPTTRYNYMTSNSVESVNALTKDVQKLPITMLMDWFRDLLQKWYYERRAKHKDAPDDELTEWATAKVKGECTCRKWKLSGLPCGHICAMARFAGFTSVAQLAKPWFLNRNLKGTYEGIIYPLQDVSSWNSPHEYPLVLPPIMGKNLPGRPKNKDHIPSQGEGRINNKYGRCGAKGHY
ncbi:transposase, MuDR, MULE transposase domain protein [Tanacetum coccineum]